ncbi:MAG TPA: DMT family transporter [Myxococcaceae bacterium]|nr:DMT family transporter [Myxococcaceae bacterium]
MNDPHPENGGRRTGPWLILAAATLWSTAGAAIKLCGLSGWQINLGRSAVAALFLAALVPGARRRPDRSVGWVAVAYAFTVLLFVLANKATTSANAIFLQDTAPLWVLLLSPVLLHERPTQGELLSAPLFLVGLFLFFLDQLSPGQAVGNVVAVASGVAFALCILGLRKLGTRNVGAIVWGNALAALMSLPMAMRGSLPTARDVGIVLFLGLFQLGASYALFARGVRHTPAVEASLLALVEPVLNPVWTYLLAGERPGPWAIRGGAIILVATLWRTLAPWLESRRRARA